jgi:hypothetical protein
MLAVAKRLAPSIDWRDGVAESLPYEDDFFDAVISQFGLMFFHDRPVALGDGADAGVTRPDCSRRLDCLGTFRGLPKSVLNASRKATSIKRRRTRYGLRLFWVTMGN